MSKGRSYCTACGLCTLHHVGPICTSEPGFECAWDHVGFNLRSVIRSAGGSSYIPATVDGKSCPYCRWDRPVMIDMSKKPMTFTAGVYERAKNSQLPG